MAAEEPATVELTRVCEALKPMEDLSLPWLGRRPCSLGPLRVFTMSAWKSSPRLEDQALACSASLYTLAYR